jgi:Sulfotransferase family
LAIDVKALDRILHRIALDIPSLTELTFDLERRIYFDEERATNLNRPVFVIGLARAGTSLITRLLHTTGQFSSLTYRDMPFPLAPNLWARATGALNRTNADAERGHGDGLSHNLDSPEALEEVFWRLFEGNRYIRTNRLIPVVPKQQTLQCYRQLVALVAMHVGRDRYLSKNNNNILRLSALYDLFPDAIFLHPIRDPVQQAASLLNQHKRAQRLHSEDPFRKGYMTWLAHHEFGGDHRPFAFESSDHSDFDHNDGNYWLRYWIEVYSYLKRHRAPQNSFFVDFDKLCSDPLVTLEQLSKFSDCRVSSSGIGEIRAPQSRAIERVSPTLERDAYRLHSQLVCN